MTTSLTTIPNFKVVIYSVHPDPVHLRALAFVNTVEPTARGGLARAYRTKAGDKLSTLNEVANAANDGSLASNPPA